VQLPIPELVDVLLKFNAEQAEAQRKVEGESILSHSLLASLPEASPFSFPDASMYTPKNGSKGVQHASKSSEYAEDDYFSRISIQVARQDPFLQDYKERSMWRSETGRFFRAKHLEKQDELVNKQLRAYELFEQLPVNEHFLSTVGMDCGVPEPCSEFGLPPVRPSSTKLSADAPVFTPGSAFASTQGSDNGVRSRAMSADAVSDVHVPLARQDRVMSAAAGALAATCEEERSSSSFWAGVVGSKGEEECKQM
jgi:hypothetical protein